MISTPMSKILPITSFFAITLALCSATCTKEKKVPVFYSDSVDDSVVEYAQSGDFVSVPFREENGIKYIPVTVNGSEFEMVFDPGCSTTQLSRTEADNLIANGSIGNDDFIGKAYGQLADGSRTDVESVVNLSEVVVGGRIRLTNVEATISSSYSAPLIIGNSVLDRLAAITIDNQTKTINFQIY